MHRDVPPPQQPLPATTSVVTHPPAPSPAVPQVKMPVFVATGKGVALPKAPPAAAPSAPLSITANSPQLSKAAPSSTGLAAPMRAAAAHKASSQAAQKQQLEKSPSPSASPAIVDEDEIVDVSSGVLNWKKQGLFVLTNFYLISTLYRPLYLTFRSLLFQPLLVAVVSDSNGPSKTGVISVIDVLLCAKQWRDETVNRLVLDHRSHLCEHLCTLAATLCSDPMLSIEGASASDSIGDMPYQRKQISLVQMSMRQLPSSSDLFDSQRKLLKTQASAVEGAIAYLSAVSVNPKAAIENLIKTTKAEKLVMSSVDQVRVELSDALLQAGSLLAPAQLQMLRAETTYSNRSMKGLIQMQENVVNLSAASAETSLWCLYVVPNTLKDEVGHYFPSTAGLFPRATFVFSTKGKEIKVTGDIPSSAVLLSSALASLYDAQAALAFGKATWDEQSIHGYGRLALALQAAIKLIADTDKSSQPNPLLVPLYLRLLWTSMSLFHNSLDSWLTNQKLFVGGVNRLGIYRATKLCLMLHAVARKFLFGKQHGDLDAYVSTAWDALVRQVSTSPSVLPSSAI